MQTMKTTNRLPSGLVLAALGITGTAACAQASPPDPSSPYYFGASQAFTRESNVFRVPTGQPESSDTYSTTSLLAGIDQPIGRQRLFGDAAVRYNSYRENSQLDHTAYSADLGIDWETVQALSGRVAYTIKEGLARYGADQGPLLTTKNLERGQQFSARGQYGAVSTLSLDASYVHRRLDYSAPEFAFQEFSQDAVRLGLLYRPGGLLTLGIGVRHTEGEYPFAIVPSTGATQADEFSRNDIDLTAAYVVTGQSTLNARLSYTKEEHDAVTGRDLSAATGAISWDYKPTGKLAFKTEVIRDTGAETAFFGLSESGASGVGVGNNSTLSNTLAVRAVYDVTAKVQLVANGRYVERDLTNTQGGGLPTEGSDRYGEAKLGLNWMPTRSLTFACAFGREKRATSSPLSYGYAANVATCLGQIKLQG
jgi:hypothetical protein